MIALLAIIFNLQSTGKRGQSPRVALVAEALAGLWGYLCFQIVLRPKQSHYIIPQKRTHEYP